MSETKPGLVQIIDDAVDELGDFHRRHCCKGQSFCRTLEVHGRLVGAGSTAAKLLTACEWLLEAYKEEGLNSDHPEYIKAVSDVAKAKGNE